MWLLTHSQSGMLPIERFLWKGNLPPTFYIHNRISFVVADIIFYVNAPKTSVGRKGTDIEILSDDSISRIHAHFLLSDDNELKLQDSKSKYGIFTINAGVETRIITEAQLKDGDVIRFGRFRNDWIVHQLHHKTAISMVDNKDKLLQILNNLKVKVSDQVDETCTHLTMPAHTRVSGKLLQALSSCKPVVTPNYWVAFQYSVNNNKALPKCVKYLPQINDNLFITPGMVSLHVNRDRQKLFAGKKFVFVSSTQMCTFQSVIQNAGGQAFCLSRTKMTISDCCAKNAIVIQPKDSSSQSSNEGEIMKIKSRPNQL